MSALLNNRYRILQTLGSGGCGKTFLAEDAHMPSKRRCVIKQLKPATDDPITYQIIHERFQREAATLEMLGMSSDQIPALHAYFTESEEFYLVQDWVEGKSLMQKVREGGAFSESQVKEILLNLLPVLDYIHSQGIIHRDIKPENIMLRERDSKPVLIDFGAVKEVVATVIDIDGSPTSSIVIGSPGFMPLEQAAGKPVFASDLYSLGLTAIYLLTGKRPKELTDLLTGEIFWRRHAANVSPEFAATLDKAIQPLILERYRTAREMLEALRLADGDPDLTLTAKRTKSRVNTPTSFPKSRGQELLLWTSILIWGIVGSLAGLASGFISSLTPMVVEQVNGVHHVSFGIGYRLGPSIVFGTAAHLFGKYAGLLPMGKGKRFFGYLILIIASTLGWNLALTIAFFLTFSLPPSLQAVGFLIAATTGGIFIILAEILFWHFASRRWIYAVLITTVAGLSGFMVAYVYDPDNLYLLFAIWQALVLASHIAALKIVRKYRQERT